MHRLGYRKNNPDLMSSLVGLMLLPLLLLHNSKMKNVPDCNLK